MDRHFTVSGFVVHERRVALHWHRKLEMWLPAGGHVEAGEDPVQATLREVSEEYGLEAAIVPTSDRVSFRGGPAQIVAPYAVQDCRVTDDHYHVDFIYFCRVLSGYPGISYDEENPLVWMDTAELESGGAIVRGEVVPFAPDVQALGLEAIRRVDAVVAAGTH